jgi:hypothetical protein
MSVRGCFGDRAKIVVVVVVGKYINKIALYKECIINRILRFTRHLRPHLPNQPLHLQFHQPLCHVQSKA